MIEHSIVKRTPSRLLLVTGLSGAGKSTALRALEDLGWEVFDNLPLSLLGEILDLSAETCSQTGKQGMRALAIGIDSCARGFQPESLFRHSADIAERSGCEAEILYLDCTCIELKRRSSQARRCDSSMAKDRYVGDRIVQESAMMKPLQRQAEHLVETSLYTVHDLQQEIHRRFSLADNDTTLFNLLSFGFAHGVPRHADLVFDMRFLLNPRWVPELRMRTGCDVEVGAYIETDPAYTTCICQIEQLLLTLLPRYTATGRTCVTIAFGCTSGQHRSVHVAHRISETLCRAGHFYSLTHRDLDSAPRGKLETKPPLAIGDGDDEIC